MSDTVKIFATIMFDDAVTILNQYRSQVNETDELFNAAQEVMDSGDEEEDTQFELSVSKTMAEWLASMIRAEFDESGIFEHILIAYNEKTGLKIQ